MNNNPSHVPRLYLPALLVWFASLLVAQATDSISSDSPSFGSSVEMKADGYSLTSTIGQAVVETSDSTGPEGYELSTGVWTLYVDAGPVGPVELTLTRASSGLVLTWPAGIGSWILESTSSLTGNPVWTPVNPPAQSSSYPITTRNRQEFFRLRQP